MCSWLGTSITLGLKNSFASANSAAASAAVSGARSIWFPPAAICTGRCNETVEAGTPAPGVWIVSARSIVYTLDAMHVWNVGTHVFDDGKAIGTRMVAE